MQQVTLHFLLLAATGVLVIRVSSEGGRNETAVDTLKNLIEEEQITNDKAKKIHSELTTFLQNGISESLRKMTESFEKLKEEDNDLIRENINSQIPPCALTQTKALQNIVNEFSIFSSFLVNSEFVTGNSHASLQMFLQTKSFATLSSAINGVITNQLETLHKYCQTQSEENELQAVIQKRYTELENIFDDVALHMQDNILRLLTQRDALFKAGTAQMLQINLKPTDIGGYAFRGVDQTVMMRFRQEKSTTRARLLRKLHELCRGLDLEMCQDNLNDYYPLTNGAVLEKSLFPTFDMEEISFKLMQAEDCVNRFREYKRCQAVKNIIKNRICPIPVCAL